jgi:hypothetical protein
MKPTLQILLVAVFIVGCRREESAESVVPAIVELKSGHRIEGGIKSISRFGLVMQVEGRIATTPIGDIRAIYLDTKNTATSADQEVIEALKGIQALINVGTNVRDFSTKVAEISPKIEKLPQGETEKSIRAALFYYMLAARAWSARATISSDYPATHALLADVGRAVKDGDCLEAKSYVRGTKDPSVAGLMLGEHPQPLWSCASTKLSEAEKVAMGK